MIRLKGRTVDKHVDAKIGMSILELAIKHKVDWGFNCTRGNCARCRCLIKEGMNALMEPTEAELIRLEPEEIDQGYRLGCQARIKQEAPIDVMLKPYF